MDPKASKMSPPMEPKDPKRDTEIDAAGYRHIGSSLSGCRSLQKAPERVRNEPPSYQDWTQGSHLGDF